MSRTHFEAIAAALRASHASMDTILAIAAALETSNPRFDAERFVRAAEPKS
jgi:hypothetical protein